MYSVYLHLQSLQ